MIVNQVSLRVVLPEDAHRILKDKAKDEGRSLADLAADALIQEAKGSLALGQPIMDDTPVSVDKPAHQPLSVYARGAKDLIVLGTTLRSLDQFDPFLWECAESGTRLTFASVDEEVLLSTPSMVNQIAARHDRTNDQVLDQLRKTMSRLDRLHKAYPTSVKIIRLHAFPAFGMTMVDRNLLDRAKMRVTLYLYRHEAECNPVVHIAPRTHDLRVIWYLLREHYERIVWETGDVHLPPEQAKIGQVV